MEKVLAVSVPLSAIFILRNVKIGLDLFLHCEYESTQIR